MNICGYSFNEFLQKVRDFHSYAAPGVVVGGVMVDLAYRNMPEEGIFDAISETGKCLPDAIQILTPCTCGNGWLRIIDTGRFALSMYDKKHGNGVRVSVDSKKIVAWPELKSWFLRETKKDEQENQVLLQQIEDAGDSIYRVQPVLIDTNKVKKIKGVPLGICPECGEAYPLKDGEKCLGCCGGILPY